MKHKQLKHLQARRICKFNKRSTGRPAELDQTGLKISLAEEAELSIRKNKSYSLAATTQSEIVIINHTTKEALCFKKSNNHKAKKHGYSKWRFQIG